MYLDAIALSAENLLRIINDILDLSKLDADRLDLEMTPMDPGALVKTWSGAGPESTRQRVGTEGGPGPWIACIHPRRPHPAAAAGVQPGRERGEIHHGRTRIDRRPDRRDRDKGQCILFTVEDTGPGIPPERAETIFEEFNKAYAYSDGHGRYGGTRLSLAISKRLAELHGGTLTLESRLGKGAPSPPSPLFLAAPTKACRSRLQKDRNCVIASTSPTTMNST